MSEGHNWLTESMALRPVFISELVKESQWDAKQLITQIRKLSIRDRN